MSMTTRSTSTLACSLLALCLGVGALPAARAEASGRAAYRINGVRFDVVTLTLAGDPARIAGALAADWRVAREPPRRLQRRGSAWILGRQRGSLHETVELRPGRRPGVVEGRVSVIDLASRPARAALPPFAMPPGLRRLQVIEDLEAAERPVVFILASRVGVLPTWARLQHALERAGFTATARAPAGTGQASGSRFVTAHGADASVEGVIQPRVAGARLVLLHRRHRTGAADAIR